MNQKFISLRDMNNDKLIGTYNVTNVEGSVMDYYYYYFGGYENYIKYLLKRGAVLHENEVPESHPHHKLVPIYEVPLVKVNINDEEVKDKAVAFLEKLNAITMETGVVIETFGDPHYNPNLCVDDNCELSVPIYFSYDVEQKTYIGRIGNPYDGEIIFPAD